ncbi:class I SAM-dependent methyltransferase (plasmid) [Halobaculum sp. CBA1158]|uniref:class I SAM-dependent methyltransferase n=1 Tax=Halobaculum sp. CBA1158 TaxID=2904243 RepID=UPI001F18E527|nr:methyltransferase domain-containing protein [Halobaculum sp. CBA1158]UIP01735.1 class I SAM-dependent methyltransferase [Halobaculum sp. CBA1158]
MTRVLDLGSGTDPDPRATETVDLYAEADLQFDLDEEWPITEASVDGIVASHVVEHLSDPATFFDRAAAALSDDGWLEITVPVGVDGVADPDHETQWTWRTPATFCREHSERHGRAWDADPPLVMTDRNANLWLFPPFSALTPALQAFAERWPAEAVRRCSSGEIIARYRRVVR